MLCALLMVIIQEGSLESLKICFVVFLAAGRYLGRRGPSLPPSSSLMRSTLSPVKEEGTVDKAVEHKR